MTFTLEETPDSGESTTSPPTVTYKYVAEGETDQNIVWSYALGATPFFVLGPPGILYRQDIKVKPVGHALYEVTVPYAPNKREVGSYHFSFDTTGATVKVKVAREHIHSYPDTEASLDQDGNPNLDDDGNPIINTLPTNPHKGAIGIKQDGDVDGADLVTPALKLTVTFKHPQGQITIAQAKNLAGATGKTNVNQFLGFAAGELLYLGSTGSEGTECETEVAYQFAASSNESGLTFGGITGIVKAGWAFAWVEFKEVVDDKGGAATVAKRVHIERVYNSCDYAGVFGWS